MSRFVVNGEDEATGVRAISLGCWVRLLLLSSRSGVCDTARALGLSLKHVVCGGGIDGVLLEVELECQQTF